MTTLLEVFTREERDNNKAQTWRDAQEAIGLLRSLANEARTPADASELSEMADRVAELFP